MPFIKNQVKLKNLLSCLEALYLMTRRHRFSTGKFCRLDARLPGSYSPATGVFGSSSLKVRVATLEHKLEIERE